MMMFRFVVVAAMATAPGFFLVAGPQSPTSPGIADGASDPALVGIEEMLSNHPEFAFEDVAFGLAHPLGTRDFRARLVDGARARPAFGQVEPLCPAQRHRATCWTIRYLEANGDEIALGPNPVTPVASNDEEPLAAVKPSAPKTTQAAVETFADRDQVAMHSEPMHQASGVQTSVAPSDAMHKTIPQKPLHDAAASRKPGAPVTHVVARARINARSGPGTTHPVVRKLERGTPLSLIEVRDDWARFALTTDGASGTEFWAAQRLVERAPLVRGR